MKKTDQYNRYKGLFIRWFKLFDKANLNVYLNKRQKEKSIKLLASNERQLINYFSFLNKDKDIIKKLPKGWLKTFVFDLLWELKLLHLNPKYGPIEVTDMYVSDGMLIVDTTPTCLSKELTKLKSKYREISMCYCPLCGDPARYLSDKDEYLCEDCFDSTCKKRFNADANSKYFYDHHFVKDDFRLTKDNIPCTIKIKTYRLFGKTIQREKVYRNKKLFKKMWVL